MIARMAHGIEMYQMQNSTSEMMPNTSEATARPLPGR